MALIVREKHVRALLNMPNTVDVLEEAFNALAQGLAVNEPRTRLVFAGGVLNVLAAALPTLGYTGFKTYTASREGIRYVVMLFSTQNGKLLAIIEANVLGSMRTGGASALATKYLARTNATIVGMIGAGQQAFAQLLGMCSVRPITLIYVYSRGQREREIFCQEMTRLLKIQVLPVLHPRYAVEEADIVITATTSSDPVLQGEWLKPGCHINAIGSNWPQKRELDRTTLQRSALIITDSLEQARIEAGDLIIPAEEGFFDWGQVYELADVVGNTGLRRETQNDITLYKGLGIALEDVVIAAHVYELALKQGMGEEIELVS